MRKSKSANFMTGFILGLAAGSAIGLLLAPARGKEVRQRLGNQAPQLGNRAGAAAQRALVQSKGLAAQGLAKLGATAVTWKALLIAEKKFRRLNAPDLMRKVYLGAEYQEGIEIVQEVAAA